MTMEIREQRSIIVQYHVASIDRICWEVTRELGLPAVFHAVLPQTPL
jgi:hypothetical protein